MLLLKIENGLPDRPLRWAKILTVKGLVGYSGNVSESCAAHSVFFPAFLGIFSLFTPLVPVLLMIVAGGNTIL